jgi:hypothetical protein
MKRTHYFLLSAFIVGAALWKAGVPLSAIVVGISAVACINLLRSSRPSPR